MPNHQDNMPSHRIYGYSHLWAEFCGDMLDAADCPVDTITHEVDVTEDADLTAFKINGRWITVRASRRILDKYWKQETAPSSMMVAEYYEGCRKSFLEVLAFERDSPWPQAEHWIETWELLKGMRKKLSVTVFKPKKRRMRVKRG